MNFKDYKENVLNEEHEAYLNKQSDIIISELHPNEAEFISNKLKKAGINATYEYSKGIYYQRVIIKNGNTNLLNKVNSIISKK